MLSRTEVKNGTTVENAALSVALAGEGVWWGYFTITAVAKEAKKSKPTVQKYLDLLEQNGQVKQMTSTGYPRNTKLYKWTGTLMVAGV